MNLSCLERLLAGNLLQLKVWAKRDAEESKFQQLNCHNLFVQKRKVQLKINQKVSNKNFATTFTVDSHSFSINSFRSAL